jgi:hypothetical protein
MKPMQKKSPKTVLIIALSIAGLGVIGCAAFSLFYRPYTAVYLTTGDIYFGKTNLFPCVKIQDPWFLQRAEDGGLSLEKFSDAVWAPKGGMKISRDQIVFISRLSDMSPVIAAIEGKSVPQQITQPPAEENDESIELDEDINGSEN